MEQFSSKANKCIVINCNNDKKGELFKFPSCAIKKITWMKALNMNELPTDIKVPKICLRHFNKSDVNISAFRSTLKAIAVPYLNENNSIELPLPIVSDIEMDSAEILDVSNETQLNKTIKEQILMNSKNNNLLHKLHTKSKIIRRVKQKFNRVSNKCINLKDALQEVQKKVGIDSSINDYLQSCAGGEYNFCF